MEYLLTTSVRERSFSLCCDSVNRAWPLDLRLVPPKGFKNFSPFGAKSATSQITTTRPCTSAVCSGKAIAHGSWIGHIELHTALCDCGIHQQNAISNAGGKYRSSQVRNIAPYVASQRSANKTPISISGRGTTERRETPASTMASQFTTCCSTFASRILRSSEATLVSNRYFRRVHPPAEYLAYVASRTQIPRAMTLSAGQ